MSEHKIPIPSMLYNAAVGGHVTNSQQIIDENLNREQNDINQETVGTVPYNSTTPNGMGRIVLKKNDNFKQVVEAQTNGNTIFIIKYDFDLNNENITIPENCVLKFDGGSIKNGRIDFNNTIIEGGLNVKLINIDPHGRILNEYFMPEWFGAKSDGITDCTKSFETINKYITNFYIDNDRQLIPHIKRVILQAGTYIVSQIKSQGGVIIEGAGMFGTTIKTNTNNEKGVVSIVNNAFIIRNVRIDGGEENGLENTGIYIYGNNAQNSTIESVKFSNCSKHSAVVEDVNMICFDRCQFNSGKEGFLLLDGADDSEVSYCTFEYSENYIAPYGIKVVTETTGNKIANSCVIRGNWWENSAANGFTKSIIAAANNVHIYDNHFHCTSKSPKDYVLYVDNGAQNIIFYGNNIQGKGISSTGETEKVIGTAEGIVCNVYAGYSAGLYNTEDVEMRCTHFYIEFINRTFLSSVYIAQLNKYDEQNQHLSPFVLNKLNIWYDKNNIPRYKFDTPNNNTDGMPFGTYLKYGGTGLPVANAENAGLSYIGGKSLLVWNGTDWINIRKGIENNISDSGTADLMDVAATKAYIGFKFMLSRNGMDYPAWWNGEEFIFSDSFPAKYVRNGFAGNRPTDLQDKHAGFIYFNKSIKKPQWWNGTKWIDADGYDADNKRFGLFADKPENPVVGFHYFCTDRQTIEGANDGIEIIYKGNNVWVDALGRVVS